MCVNTAIIANICSQKNQQISEIAVSRRNFNWVEISLYISDSKHTGAEHRWE